MVVSKAKIQFHIEGDPDLRKGFNMLISQKLKHPFIINMDKDRGNTVKQYKNDKASNKFLIIDLENHPSERIKEIDNLSLSGHTNNTCFMIQKMEAWFISQADELFDQSIAAKLTGNPEHIDNPDKIISRALYDHRGKGYNKKIDGLKYLQLLNLSQLENKFPDVKNLVEELAKA